jgi:hypothetical protein
MIYFVKKLQAHRAIYNHSNTFAAKADFATNTGRYNIRVTFYDSIVHVTVLIEQYSLMLQKHTLLIFSNLLSCSVLTIIEII